MTDVLTARDESKHMDASSSSSTTTNCDIQDHATSLLNAWLSIEQFQQQKKNQFPRITEQGGPLALAVNLSHIPVKKLTETFQANPEEAKSHPGTRTTFYIVKFLYAGWSSVAIPGSSSMSMGGAAAGMDAANAMGSKRQYAGGNARKGNAGAGGGQGNVTEVKEKLSFFYEQDHVVLHSFALVNQRGNYVRNGKSEECCLLSPGMIMTSKVWGNKFEKTFKEQTTDINVFDVVLVQFGMHSIGSSAKENGMMLEIKSYNHLACLTPSSFLFLAPKMLPSSLQECTLRKNRFVDASHAVATVQSQQEDGPVEDVDAQMQHHATTTTTGIKGLFQDMIKGNISSSCFFLRVVPTQSNGMFSIGPDDVMKFFVHQPIVDLPSGTGTLIAHFNPADFIHNYPKVLEQKPNFETSSSFREWVLKLFNVLTLMEAVEMLVVVDTYKTQQSGGKKDVPTSQKPLINASSMMDDAATGGNDNSSQQLLMDAYVRINVNVITESLIRANADGLVTNGSNVAFVASGSLASIAQHLLVFPYATASPLTGKINGILHVAWDTRKINRKKASSSSEAQPQPQPQQENSLQESLKLRQHSTSIIAPESQWDSAHAIYLFFDERLVHYFYIPLPQSAIQADTSRLFLSTVSEMAIALPEDCEFEVVNPTSSTPAASSKNNKKQKKT